MRKLILLALLALVGVSNANAASNCTGTGALPNRCTAITDPAPATGVQPVSCNIYTAATGGTVYASGAVAGPAGAKFCSVALPVIPVGTITIYAAWVGTDSVESPRGAPAIVVSAVPLTPLAAPQNLRVIP